MTDRQMRHMITHAIAAARPIAEKYYHLCWWEEAVRCQHVRHTAERHEVFFMAPGSVLAGGLSAVQWRLIVTRITEFARRRSIALDIHSGRGKSGVRGGKRRRRVTEFDSARLRTLLSRVRTLQSEAYAGAYRHKLRRLLHKAEIVSPAEIAEDVVTMNSQVRLRNDENDVETDMFLVFPAEARGSDFLKPKLSILTQTGLSMLGRSVGERIDERLWIADLLYQPEAAGDLGL